MNKFLAAVSLGLAVLLAPTAAKADVDVGIAIGVPFYGSPYYYGPGPVWQGPAVIYNDFGYRGRPHYYGPPRPYYRGYRGGYRDYRHDRRWRGDDRGWRGRGRGHDHHHGGRHRRRD